ncbi:MAG: Na/Pi cotransporter family protein [Treponemataceae bacterium]|nr:Na/Pi cotransporter family protein [Treponemataceae bacterium]
MFLSIFSTVFNFAGALALLLWGMDLLSSGIQKGAGNKLEKLLKVVSGNRFTAVLTGIMVTGIIQSSSATTVMVVSFVNAQILSLTQAIGIIFGANIGTTVTAWIVSLLGFSFKISAFAIPLIGIGFFVKSLKKHKIKDFGDMILGFGLLFFGLDLLGDTLYLDPESVHFINQITDWGVWGIGVGVLIGAALTALIHSSSAFTAIVLTMAASGSLNWELSAALILGSNIGTTIDAVLASIGASINAKRAALVHVGFNIIGTIIALIFFKPFLSLVDLIVPGIPTSNITTHIAMLHTVFNTCATLIFLPFVNQIASFVTKLIKEPESEKDAHYKLPVIISQSRNTVDFYLMQIEREVAIMSSKTMTMLDEVYSAFEGYDEDSINKIAETVFAQENYIDEMHEEISAFLMSCYKMEETTQLIGVKINKLLQITSGIEALSDECASLVHSLQKYINKNPDKKTSSYEKLLPYMTQVKEFFDYVSQHLSLGLTAEEKKLSAEMEQSIDSTKKQLKKLARHRIEDGKDVKTELHYIDIVRHVEKAGDCVYSIVNSL